MARIETITTTHDKQAFAEDQADLELLASVSTVIYVGGSVLSEEQPATLVPEILAAALAAPAPVGYDANGLPDFTSMIPPPRTIQLQMQPMARSEVGDYTMPDVTAGFAETQAAAPVPSFEELLAPMSFELASASIAEPVPFEDHPATDLMSLTVFAPAPLLFDVPDGEPVLSWSPGIDQPVELAAFLPSYTEFDPTGLADVVPEPQADAVLVNPNPFAFTPEYIAATTLLQETTKHLRSIGAVNILVAGQTGVGKSTLVNSVFGEAFAVTAAGSPVTQHAEWFISDTVPLRILDTRGLEAKDYSVTLNALRAEIDNSRAQHDEKNQLHMAWVCISTPSSRVQECEIDVLKLLNKYDIPVIIVLTKYDDDEDFAEIVERIVIEKGATFTAIVAVRALARKTRPAVGLEELVTATFTALPVAHKAAFAAAQKINRDLHRTTAETYVTIAASAAAAASVIPIPFADLATLAPIQASMLVGISNAFDVTLERAQIMQLISTVLGCLAITMAGGWIIGSVLKFIPGPGSLIGAMMNATVAGALTRTLGRAYIRFLYAFLEVNRRLPTADEIFDLFPTFYKAGRKATVAA